MVAVQQRTVPVVRHLQVGGEQRGQVDRLVQRVRMVMIHIGVWIRMRRLCVPALRLATLVAVHHAVVGPLLLPLTRIHEGLLKTVPIVMHLQCRPAAVAQLRQDLGHGLAGSPEVLFAHGMTLLRRSCCCCGCRCRCLAASRLLFLGFCCLSWLIGVPCTVVATRCRRSGSIAFWPHPCHWCWVWDGVCPLGRPRNEPLLVLPPRRDELHDRVAPLMDAAVCRGLIRCWWWWVCGAERVML
mmetsp:Transcript_18986/g.54431  ORF Transcript_18986/g.54431 Transcript_18986/m.54431 type:complete len:241 (+) Transcript_18986:892-1614(+)